MVLHEAYGYYTSILLIVNILVLLLTRVARGVLI